jgi:pimeloyl-ACP methyl ester carboxylesterase
MSRENVSVVLVHGAWADGSSWAKVIGPLAAEGIRVLAAPLPLTSFAEDTAAVERTLERASGPVVLAGHAYAGAVTAVTRNEKVKALVYVSALAPVEGETVADVFYRAKPHPLAPKLAPEALDPRADPDARQSHICINLKRTHAQKTDSPGKP